MTNDQAFSPVPKSSLLLGTLLLCIGLIAGGLWIRQTPWHFAIDVGAEPPFIVEGQTASFQNYFLFHASEKVGKRTFRWMGERGTVTIPYAMRMQPLMLDIVACRCRLDAPATPVQLMLNNAPMCTMTATPDWRNYHILVPPRLPHPDYSLMVDMRAPVWEDDHGRDLSLAVDRIALHQIAPVSIADPVSTLVVVVGVCAMAWWKRSLVLPVLLGMSWLVVNAVYQPQFLPRSVLATVFVGGLIALWQFGDKQHNISPQRTQRTQRIHKPQRYEDTHSAFGHQSSVISHRSPVTGHRSSLMLALIAVWLVLSPQIVGTWFVDDAFISLQYARNFIRGDGLVFNVGEYVEGYTNFLWTMILAGVLKTGADPVLSAAILTLVLGFVIVLLTLVLSRQIIPEPWAWVAPMLLVVSTPFLLYTTRGSGMETALFTALILASLIALMKHRWLLAGALTALTILTRPDGLLLAAVGGMYCAMHCFTTEDTENTEDTSEPQGKQRFTTKDTENTKGTLKRLRPFIRYSVVVLALFVPYFIWRWKYYGYLLPNTFYVKVGSTEAQVMRGLRYAWDFGCEHLLLFVGIGGACVGAIIGALCSKKQRPWFHPSHVVLVGTLVGLFCLYIVAVGGDWMPGARFFVPMLPLLAILGAWGMAGIAYHLAQFEHVVFVGAGALLIALVLMLPRDSSYNPESLVWRENSVVRRNREVGRWLNAHTSPDTVISAAAGAMPYYAERTTIDILGLTDEHIAHLPSTTLGEGKPGHEKTDPAYVMARRPDIIPWATLSYLADEPAIKTRYRSDWFHGPEGYAIWLYIRKDVPLQGP